VVVPEGQAYFRRLVALPDLRIRSEYDGYWFWGRPTLDELVGDLRAISAEIRTHWKAPAA
jgi:hypothetical protein